MLLRPAASRCSELSRQTRTAGCNSAPSRDALPARPSLRSRYNDRSVITIVKPGSTMARRKVQQAWEKALRYGQIPAVVTDLSHHNHNHIPQRSTSPMPGPMHDKNFPQDDGINSGGVLRDFRRTYFQAMYRKIKLRLPSPCEPACASPARRLRTNQAQHTRKQPVVGETRTNASARPGMITSRKVARPSGSV